MLQLMRTRVLALCLALLLVGMAACAQQGEARPQWWPAEGPAAQNTVTGKVTAVSAASITLQTRQGPATFVVNEQTRVMVRGEKATIEDVEVGDPASVRVGVLQDGTRFARGILVPKPWATGKITAIAGNAITLTSREKVWTVTLTPTTRMLSHRYVGTPEDLRIGYLAGADGDIEGDNVTATTVRFQGGC